MMTPQQHRGTRVRRRLVEGLSPQTNFSAPSATGVGLILIAFGAFGRVDSELGRTYPARLLLLYYDSNFLPRTNWTQ